MEIISWAACRGDEGDAISSRTFSRSIPGGDRGDSLAPSKGEKGRGGGGAAPEPECEPPPPLALSLASGGWPERRRPGKGRLMPIMSELKVRGTESMGESGRLGVFLIAEPGKSSAHSRCSDSRAVFSLLAERRSFSRSARASSSADSADLTAERNEAASSYALSRSCCDLTSAGWMSSSSSSKFLARVVYSHQ